MGTMKKETHIKEPVEVTGKSTGTGETGRTQKIQLVTGKVTDPKIFPGTAQ